MNTTGGLASINTIAASIRTAALWQRRYGEERIDLGFEKDHADFLFHILPYTHLNRESHPENERSAFVKTVPNIHSPFTLQLKALSLFFPCPTLGSIR